MRSVCSFQMQFQFWPISGSWDIYLLLSDSFVHKILLYSCQSSCNTEHVYSICLHILPFICFLIDIYLTFKKHWLSFAQYSHNMCCVVHYAFLSLCTIGVIKDNWDLSSSWSRFGYLFLGSDIAQKWFYTWHKHMNIDLNYQVNK